MPAVRACCLAFLLWLCTALPAHAHTLITVTLEMVADGEELTLNLGVSAVDIIACLAPNAPTTRGQLRALAQVLGPYLLSHLVVSCDGVALDGVYDGYLPDLLKPGAAIVADEALPLKLSFVLTWKLPPSAGHLAVALSLFREEGLPGFCQLVLETGGGRKRQVAYVELGKSWTFPLHAGGAAGATAPPASSQAPLTGSGAPATPSTIAQRIGDGLGMLIGWLPLLLAVLLVALHPVALKAVLVQAALFASAEQLGLVWCCGRGSAPSMTLAAMLSAGAVVALALVNLAARADGRAGPRLALLGALGLLQGWALSAAARAGEPALGGVASISGFVLGSAFGELGMVALAVGTTAWTWGSDRHRRYVVIPSSLLAVLLALLWALLRTLPQQPPITG